MGGLSIGFKAAGFEVHGYEHNRHALATYRANVGPADDLDLATATPALAADCVVGGPPCRPWSPMNLQRRRQSHDDYELVRAFDRIVLEIKPAVFVMENVPSLRSDKNYLSLVENLTQAYDVSDRIVRYSDWGAASRRRRLFVIGIKRSTGVGVAQLASLLDGRRREAQTVRSAISRFGSGAGGVDADHDWPRFRTIAKYESKYDSNQYGWYRLKWDEAAPSFGNVSKTYTLHPGDGNGSQPRVVSPREVMAILGFPDTYAFPVTVPRSAKYRMVADAVSPTFGRALADSIREVLELVAS
jgi:site-specific DNA-cytosine methylase